MKSYIEEIELLLKATPLELQEDVDILKQQISEKLDTAFKAKKKIQSEALDELFEMDGERF